jgi:hypothetical protein
VGGKEPHLAHTAPDEDAAEPTDSPTCLGRNTLSSVESATIVSGPPTSDPSTAPQGLQEARELAQGAVQRGGVEPRPPGTGTRRT